MERRKYTRVNVVCPVTLTGGNEKPVEGVITNLSMGGIGVISSTSFEVGTAIKLTFSLVDNLGFTELKGFVTRSEILGDKFFNFIGVNFLGMDNDKKTLINKYVLDKKLEQYNLKSGR